MVSVKPEVRPWSLHIAAALSQVSKKLNQDLVITSGNDGKHMKNSFHYSNAALDVRIWNLKDVLSTVQEISNELGDDYDVVLEIDHIHIERDPD